ncbi:hypothetical protein JCM3775_005216 [Rhodotorula graminis]
MSTPYGSGQDLSRLQLIKGHLTAKIPKPVGNLTGRVALVTGATSGLGFEAALHFARLNTEVIVFGVRSPAKAAKYIEQLYKEVPTFRGEVKTIALDYSSFASVRSFAKELSESVPRLDFAVLNAGVANTQHIETKDGWSEDIQVNVISTGLLGVLLLPKLQETAKLPQPSGAQPANLKPQLHLVASEVHWWLRPSTAKILVEASDAGRLLETTSTPEYRKQVPYDEIYNTTKLLCILMARKIGGLSASQGIQVTSSSPGLCKSALRDSMGSITAWLINAVSWRGEFGTRTYLHAMLEPHAQGTFVFQGKEQPTSRFSCSVEGVRMEDEMWKEATEIFRKVTPEVDDVLR